MQSLHLIENLSEKRNPSYTFEMLHTTGYYVVGHSFGYADTTSEHIHDTVTSKNQIDGQFGSKHSPYRPEYHI